jgi:hypothetical protein
MCQHQPRSPQSRERERLAPAPVTARRMRENREYVRTLLARKQPEFARALAVAEQEIAACWASRTLPNTHPGYLKSAELTIISRVDDAEPRMPEQAGPHLDEGSDYREPYFTRISPSP